MKNALQYLLDAINKHADHRTLNVRELKNIIKEAIIFEEKDNFNDEIIDGSNDKNWN